MTTFSLGQAAKLAGVGKTTISRAIASGRLSAERKEDGGYSIDASELARVYEIRPERLEKGATAGTVEEDGPEERYATPGFDPAEEVRRQLEIAVLQEQIKALRDLIQAEKDRREAAEVDRDRWADQAARVAALLPPPAANTDIPRKGGLLDRLFGRKSA